MASKYIALPKGVSEKMFDAAVKEFRRVLGEGNVLTSAQQLAPYTKIMMPVPQENHTPSAAILATTVEQIQKILVICNTHKVPIWTISTGKNLNRNP
jgi:4-cresol dehydrogenase (hydroxylating) flavoprotein subunit